MCIKKIILAILLISSPLLLAQVKIDSVIYKGLKRTDVQFIRKISDIKKEQFYDSLKIENDLRFIRRLPSVSFVKAELKKDTLSNKNILEKTFKENITLIPTFQVWSAVNQTAFRIGLAEFNFLGANKQLGGFYQYNGYHSGSIAFEDPFLFSKKSGIEARLQQITTVEPVFFNRKKTDYLYTITSVEWVYLYQPNVTHRFQVSATLFQEKYHYVSGIIPSEFPLDYKVTKSQIRLITNTINSIFIIILFGADATM
jgi:outer membrane protein assembly factor BamA